MTIKLIFLTKYYGVCEVIMSWLANIFRRARKANVVVAGGAQAGKTTLIKYLETGHPVTENFGPTFGVDIRQKPIKIDKWLITACDLGGQQPYVINFWENNIKSADAVIYLIDGCLKESQSSDSFEKSVINFNYMIEASRPNQPILVLINKQDLKDLNPLTVQEAIDLYDMKSSLKGFSFNVLPTSAKFGEGVISSI